MSLSDGFLDELRSRISLGQVVGRKVMWDQRKSQPGKGDLWAPCPFHQEKTASFHVDDRKGFYYCFGCHAKGDAISFVRETENVDFMEAIEILAKEAGMTLPARDPRAAKQAEARDRLGEIMDQAVRYFRRALSTGPGAEARAYLDRRGLSEAARDRWEIGFAPAGWQGLRDHLTGQGVAEKDLLACGLIKDSSRGGKPYDTFRNRIMFPIRDPRGRCIAFGGRAMDPEDNAKYLNSPQTQLFDKSVTLYNHGRAREASGKGAQIVVAEGYMDVIALGEAGFTAVAPLGTAVTEAQLDMLWRMSGEPVVALDGDRAGLEAAKRVMRLALPKLKPGQTLNFALMPPGKDPDDVIRAEGPEGMQKQLAAAVPLVDLLWQEETEGRTFNTPDRRAALDAALKTRLGAITDETLRYHYSQALRDRQRELFRPAPRPRTGATGRGFPPRLPSAALPLDGTRRSFLAAADEGATDRVREAVILATCLATPQVVGDFLTRLELMECRDPLHLRVRDAILTCHGEGDAPLKEAVMARLGPEALDELMARDHVALCPAVRDAGNLETAELTLEGELAKLRAFRGWAEEMAEAQEEIAAAETEAMTWRLSQAAVARDRAARQEQEDRAEYDQGDNGARINRAERGALDAILGAIRFSKTKKSADS
ncbi:DNA primase [Pseudooceanicola aestuarii]|uniref:DNA primase n=1 Tax=Pseudooceanicola aestuarii TaxID=2697319 RepID=UPI0013D58C27|nr:DNA primase [Pseudooceanicola aestuarii]